MPEKYRRPHTHEKLQAVERMKRDWAAQKAALATVRRFNAANGKAWFWPKIATALVAKHHWVVIACDACGTVVDLDLRVKPRDPEASICFNNGSAALIAQTDSEGVFKTEAAIRLFDETSADLTGAVAESPTFDNSPDQIPDGPMAGQGNLLSLVVAIIASCPARPSQALGICP